MARLVQEPLSRRKSVVDADPRAALTRVLARLQTNILHADAERERRLRASETERRKAGINLEYARTLLATLESDAPPGLKIGSRRPDVAVDLSRKREIVEQIAERLRELEELGGESEDESEEEEDLLAGVVATPSKSSEPVGVEEDNDEQVEEDKEEEVVQAWTESHVETTTTIASTPAPTHTAPITTNPEPTTTSSTLRPRGIASTSTTAPPPAPTDTATTTATLRSQLLGAAASKSQSSTATTTATAEAILDHHRAEQDKLTESMVAMAKTLKASTHAFSSSLREDQDVLAGAGKALDRSERGLETVAGRMGSLRRLTEGKGWWGRMMLYAWIAGLAVFAILLVFVFPKLRF